MGRIPRNSYWGKRGYKYVSMYGRYYKDIPSWVKGKKSKRKTTRRRRGVGGHAPIRSPCPNCRHSSIINRKNPSAHNHHGYCSFKRYHRSYCARRRCGCQKRR